MMRLFLTALGLALVASACTGGAVDSSESSPSSTAATQESSTSVGPEDPPQPEDPPEPEADPDDPEATSYAGTAPAPEFPPDLDWINTAAPIRLGDLVGKIVLLDFWTYGCINCIHIIPDLERLEEEFAEELVVIGVHSAKFVNEGDTDNIRQVVLRYGIEHPVVNDKDFTVWRNWGAQAWPTLALIDPAGNVVGTMAGEGIYDILQPVIESLAAEFSDDIDRTPIALDLASASVPNTILSYPGKVTTTPEGDTVFVADTGHNRIIAADAATGEISAVYGNGNAGFENGSSLVAEFDAPQGLAFDATTGILYVADTDNHAIRTIDTSTGDSCRHRPARLAACGRTARRGAAELTLGADPRGWKALDRNGRIPSDLVDRPRRRNRNAGRR